MSAGFSIAPTPTSPHASFFATGMTTTAPYCLTLSSFSAVTGCCHIAVFMAGASTHGWEKSHARSTHERRESAMPKAIFARVLAERGATTIASAHFRSSMWSTSSPTCLNLSHSSLSPSTSTPSSSNSGLDTKWREGAVATTLTSPTCLSSVTISFAFTLATLPDNPSRILFFLSIPLLAPPCCDVSHLHYSTLLCCCLTRLTAHYLPTSHLCLHTPKWREQR
mmetsp:Transcript_2523/g.5289  ORF Transcript_2523/g.5289 Transcript_2523/m.5289 type:complete len:223 (-) Transcript_2523:127-795(-)